MLTWRNLHGGRSLCGSNEHNAHALIMSMTLIAVSDSYPICDEFLPLRYHKQNAIHQVSAAQDCLHKCRLTESQKAEKGYYEKIREDTL
jgi:hypothetical protein